MKKLRTLYRPVGVREVQKILEADASRFPPRLPEQPIFYPVLNREYAEQIAQRWNVASAPGYAGFVTQFAIDSEYISKFTPHVVGSSIHRELWVPAEELDEFNSHLIGPIILVSAHYGEAYAGPTPLPSKLNNLSALAQLPQLARIRDSSGADFIQEVQTQRLLVQVNFAYWIRIDLTDQGLSLARKVAVLRAVRDVWQDAFPGVALLGGDELDALSDGMPRPEL